MSDRITIRKGRAADALQIARFNKAMAWETEEKKLELDTVEQGALHVVNNPEEGFYLMAEVDGDPAGVLMVTREWSDWRNARFWWIQSVYVDPDFRRQGVFTALYDEVVRRAKANETVCGLRLYVDADNEIAQRTYDALGMGRSNYVFFERELE